MSLKLKLAAYVILIALSLGFALAFHSSYSKISATSADQAVSPVPQPAPAPGPAQTNASLTNGSVPNNEATATNLVKQPLPPAASASPAPTQTKTGKSLMYLVAFVVSVIGLGILAAFDITQFFGSRAVDLLFDDQGSGQRDPEYEKAENAWVNGRHLEAIEMMREYLAKHPRELYVALRIAEIYEKDLRNYVAASLEYEEVLKKKLPDERWGWAAIHLCNIYTKLGKQDKTKELLERIARDYPKTGAAKKARRNLGLPEPEEEPVVTEEAQETVAEPDQNAPAVFDLDEVIASGEDEASAPEPEAPAKTPPPPEPDKPHLPPGFRPK